MSLETVPIPNLFNGVSQQPPSLRLPTQAELQENLYSAIATGTRKRPPTVHIAKLSAVTDAAAFVHFINRDANERYEVRIRNGAIEVWDLTTGTAQAVSTPDGVGYLASTSPLDDFVAVTVADYTFIVNRSIATAMLPDRSGRPITPVVLSTLTHVTTTATGTTATAHSLAVGDWVKISGAAQTAYNGWFIVASVPTTTTFTYLMASDPLANATGSLSYTAVKGAVDATKQTFSALSAGTGSGLITQITGDNSNNFGRYYVKDVGPGNVYNECIAPGILYKIDPATMPMQLVRTGVGQFTLTKVSWDDRTVGDDLSNPVPSFIGNKIVDVFFHRNRLGFLSKESLILARSGSHTNFFAQSVTAVLDSDPIDKAATYTKVAYLRSAISIDNTLMIYSDQAQFQLSGGLDGLLTPKNAKLDPVTEYESKASVRPVAAGQDVYFAVPRGGYTAIREYFVQQGSVTHDAADITAHVPSYIKGSVYQIASTTTEEILAVLANGEPNVIDIYKYYWTEDGRKLQSSWSKFVFDPADIVMGGVFIGTRLYVSFDRADGHYLEYIDFQPFLTDGTLPFLVHLDRKVTLTGTYDAINGWTTWTLPYPDAAVFQVALGDAWGANSGNLLPTVVRPSSTTIRATGDYSAHPVLVGRQYTARYRFSRFYVKDDKGQSVTSATLKVMTISVSFDKTGYFRIEVTPLNRPTYKYAYTGRKLNTGTAILGVPPIGTGQFRAPVDADSGEVTIDIVNDTFLPCNLLSAEWEADVTMRTKRT